MQQVLLLLALVVLLPSPARGGTANVSTPQEFAAAFIDDTVTEIVLVPDTGKQYGDIKVDLNNFPQTAEAPCRITRNVTITSNPALAVLDWSFLSGKCVLENATVTLRNIVTSNARFGSGLAFDVFLNSPTGGLILQDVTRRRMACLTARQDPTQISKVPRPSDVPGEQRATKVQNYCVRGQCFNNAIVYDDVALVTPINTDAPHLAGGYLMHMLNNTLVCTTMVPDTCVQKYGADTCVAQYIIAAQQGKDPESVLAGNVSAAAGGGGGSSTHIAAIVVPVVVGIALIGGVIAALMMRRRRKRKRAAEQKLLVIDPETGQPRSSDHRSSGGNGMPSDMPPPPAEGWRIVAFRTVNELVARQAKEGLGNGIMLAQLLGAGSYGKVYRGRWMGMDVAVKIMLHNNASAMRVARECELIMVLNHPSVVRAYHFVTWYLGRPRGQEEWGSGTRTTNITTSSSGGPSADTNVLDQTSFSPPTLPGEMHSSGSLDDDNDARTWIVTEYCDSGTGYDAMRSGSLVHFDGMPTILPLLCRLKEVAEGMAYLHKSGVLHGDLKSPNVLLTTSSWAPFGFMAKVSDFGLSRALVEGQTHRSTRTLGTVTHMAPQMLRSGKMSTQTDVYSFGIMMWELLTGKVAFAGLHFGEVIERVCIQNERPPVPPATPEDFRLLMEACWATDDQARPSFEAIADCLGLMIENRLQEAAAAGQHELVAAATPSVPPSPGPSAAPTSPGVASARGGLVIIHGSEVEEALPAECSFTDRSVLHSVGRAVSFASSSRPVSSEHSMPSGSRTPKSPVYGAGSSQVQSLFPTAPEGALAGGRGSWSPRATASPAPVAAGTRGGPQPTITVAAAPAADRKRWFHAAEPASTGTNLLASNEGNAPAAVGGFGLGRFLR